MFDHPKNSKTHSMLHSAFMEDSRLSMATKGAYIYLATRRIQDAGVTISVDLIAEGNPLDSHEINVASFKELRKYGYITEEIIQTEFNGSVRRFVLQEKPSEFFVPLEENQLND